MMHGPITPPRPAYTFVTKHLQQQTHITVVKRPNIQVLISFYLINTQQYCQVFKICAVTTIIQQTCIGIARGLILGFPILPWNTVTSVFKPPKHLKSTFTSLAQTDTQILKYMKGTHTVKICTKYPSIQRGSLLWPPYVIGQAIIFLPCGFFLLSSSTYFPHLISAAADWMSTILRHMVWP